MKSIFFCAIGALMALSSQYSHALIVKGEESDYHFVKIEQIDEGYSFSECHGDFDAFSCEPFYQEKHTFTKKEMRSMAKDKKAHSLFAGAADIAILVLALKTAPLAAAKAEIAWAVRAGYSLDGGVGAVSAAGAGLTVTPALSSTTIIIDGLDPFVHRDLALALDASVGDADYGDLDDIEAQDLKLDRVVTVEDVTSEQVKNSFKKLTDWALEKRELAKTIPERLERINLR